MNRQEKEHFISHLEKQQRTLIDLACTLSIAARIEPELLRIVRLDIFPKTDASLEADLWFSPLVESRCACWIVMDPEMAQILRRRLSDDINRACLVRERIQAIHANAPATLKLEEEILWQSLDRSGGWVASAEAKLGKVLKKLATGSTEERLISRWFSGAVVRLPNELRTTPTFQHIGLASSAILGGRRILDVGSVKLAAFKTLPDLFSHSTPRIEVWAVLTNRGILFSTSKLDATNFEVLSLPHTDPLLVEVSSGQTKAIIVEIERPETFFNCANPEEVEVRALDGMLYIFRKGDKNVPSVTPKRCSQMVINSPDRTPVWDDWREDIGKIILGPTPGGGEKNTLQLASFPENLAQRYPQLTHLYLWSIEGLKRLPELPPKLECLDLRGCADLTALPALPDSLETLVLDGCAKMENLPDLTQMSLANLTELSLKNCVKVPQIWIRRVLKASTALKLFDASGCSQLDYVTDWPPALERIELNECTSLKELPAEWPEPLRRAGLRGATLVAQLPDSTDKLDYLDLANMESLRNLPTDLGHPRTLFLYGSGVVMPPASEHGKDANENVALRIRAFFEDVALVGKGKVKRCKILMLGNGSAGKTCLSLALVPGKNPADAERFGSTHGVQFWDWPFRAKLDKSFQDVHLHLWDFGGQEIYHNTHRLFMSKGAVFVVLWKPDQDGKQPDRNECGYQDEWRPLQYWLDYIHLTGPKNPRIAIVCSHNATPADELKQKFKALLRPEFHNACPLFFIDSLHRAGDLGELEEWLRKEVGEVAESQGVEVPSYWEIAQDMVQGWIQQMEKDPVFASTHNHLHPDRFKESLHEAMRAVVAGGQSKKYVQLKQKLDSGGFELAPNRIERTLAFLTHSGWIFWDKKLFKGQVVVGQKWALDGIYAVLERCKDSQVFRALNRNDGRFTLPQLGEWAWNGKGFKKDEQELLRSFMEQCGLCFKLRSRHDAWREEDVYVSFEHLPTAKELRLHRTFSNRLPDLNTNSHSTTIEAIKMHKLHWQAFLMDAGVHYGKDAQYALDGFYVENEDGQKMLIICDLDDLGLGGVIEIQVAGNNSADRLKSVEGHIRKFLPGSEEGKDSDPSQAIGKRSEKKEVFISYAWNPPAKDGESGIPPGYEAPVDAIEEFLKDKPVILIRDKNVTKFGDNIKSFMEYAAKGQHVILVHSDKYWKSPYCIFELWTADQELRRKNHTLMTAIIPVEHHHSRITLVEGLDDYLDYWERFTGTPPMLGWKPIELRENARVLLRTFAKDLNACLDLNLLWKDGQGKVFSAIAARLDLKIEKKYE